MSKIRDSIYNLRILDNLAMKESSIHRIHPLAKLIVTIVYLVSVVSFQRYEIAGLVPYVFYPVLILAFAELPSGPILKRALIAAPLILGIGILNPVFDHNVVVLGGITFSRGWITFLSIILKCGLTVAAGILLIAVTGMEKLALALRLLKIPKLFVLQLLLTYRYISVLAEEVFRMQRAYSLRAPAQKGIHRSAWGSFAGQLILRTFDRAQRVYQAMSLRGFNGEYNTGTIPAMAIRDFVYMAGWCLFFIMARIYNLPVLIGTLLTGVINR